MDSRREGRNGSPPAKRTGNDDEAGSSWGPAPPLVDEERSAQGQALSCNRNSRSKPFFQLEDLLRPSTQRFCAAEREINVAWMVVDAGEEGSDERLAAAKEDFKYSFAAMNSTAQFHTYT